MSESIIMAKPELNPLAFNRMDQILKSKQACREYCRSPGSFCVMPQLVRARQAELYQVRVCNILV